MQSLRKRAEQIRKIAQHFVFLMNKLITVTIKYAMIFAKIYSTCELNLTNSQQSCSIWNINT